MPSPACPKCTGTSFELQRVVPTKSRVAFAFIVCSHCGSVVGVSEWEDHSGMLRKIMARLGITWP